MGDVGVVSDVLRQGGRQGAVGPVLIRFPHASGVDPGGFENNFKVNEFGAKFPEGGNADNYNSPNISLALSNGKMTYSTEAGSVEGRSGENPYQKTLLAIRNKKTGKVKLVETNTVLLGPMVAPPPTTNDVLIREQLKADEEVREKSEVEKKEQRTTMNKHLVGLFGQTKGKRAYEQADRMAVESSRLAQKLSQAAAGVTEEAVALPTDLNSAADADHLIPKCNKAANVVEEVYKLTDMITPDEMESLEECAVGLMEEYTSVEKIDAAVQSKTFSRLFASHVERLRNNKKLLCGAIYMEAILQFLNLRAAAFAKGPKGMAQFTHIPAAIRHKVFQEFTSVQGTVSPDTRDKAMCHIIVLALLVNKFQADFSELTSCLRTKADQIKRLARLAGATIATDSLTKTSFITLKLPLATFDMSALSAKKRGGRK